MLRKIMELGLNDSNINEFCRFDDLMKNVDMSVAKEYFEKRDNMNYDDFSITMKVDSILRKFIVDDGFDI